ncbi:MAG: LacI family transcriptional regulator, partial [Clostridiales bacterium]|nr:LacI family transcriptional regulator [Clostridiales bacterium]
MKKLLAVAISVLMMVAFFAGCGTPGAQESAPAAPAESAPAESSDLIEIAVLIKATDSDFWQYVLVGALNFAYEHSDEVHVSTYG